MGIEAFLSPDYGYGGGEEGRPRYEPAMFVNRDYEVTRVIWALKRGFQLDNKHIAFIGPRGVGKSWLLLHLHNMDIHVRPDLYPVDSIYIGFHRAHEKSSGVRAQSDSSSAEKNSEPFKFQYDMTLRKGNGHFQKLSEFLNALARALGATQVEGASLQERSYWVLDAIERKTETHPLLVLLDDVLTAPPEFLRLFEDHFLKSIVSLPGTLIVMSGRTSPKVWRAPELRFQVRRRRLGAFDKQTLENMLNRIDKGSSTQIDEIYKASGGYPLSAYFMAVHGIDEGVRNAIEAVLSFIPNREERQRIRVYIEALGVLHDLEGEEAGGQAEANKRGEGFQTIGFRKLEIEHMLKAHEEAIVGVGGELDTKRALETLMNYELLRWDQRSKGYALDEAVRHLIIYALREGKPREWKALHEAAARCYDDQAKKYAPYRANYKALAQKHRDIIGEPSAQEPAPA